MSNCKEKSKGFLTGLPYSIPIFGIYRCIMARRRPKGRTLPVYTVNALKTWCEQLPILLKAAHLSGGAATSGQCRSDVWAERPPPPPLSPGSILNPEVMVKIASPRWPPPCPPQAGIRMMQLYRHRGQLFCLLEKLYESILEWGRIGVKITRVSI